MKLPRHARLKTYLADGGQILCRWTSMRIGLGLQRNTYRWRQNVDRDEF